MAAGKTHKYNKDIFGSLELNQFFIITFLEIKLVGIELIKNQFNSNFLVWLYKELIF
jgi:hypothetical protein